MEDRPGDRGLMTVDLAADGLVRLQWAIGAIVTGEAARDAVAAVDRVCAGRRRPMLVDMAGTAALTREARLVFAEESSASIIALLGKSSVDRVIANFFLGVRPPPVPTRFFTDEPQALAWLRDGGRDGR